jgi:uncharacterized protein (DUF433 family)
MKNTESILYLNRKKLVIKDIEYIIDSKNKEEYNNRDNLTDFLQAIENSNREIDEMEEYIEMILVAANNDKNILEECENYIQHKYKVHLAETSHVFSTSVYEYCIELLKNAKIRTSLVNTVPPALVGVGEASACAEASPLENRITINPNKMNGQPCIRDLRLTVWRVIELLHTYPDRSELYQEFPDLTEEDIKQAMIYADINLKESVKAPVITNSIAHETFARSGITTDDSRVITRKGN